MADHAAHPATAMVGAVRVREGMGFIGIDSCEEYVSIARRRVAHEQEQQTGPLFAGVSVANT